MQTSEASIAVAGAPIPSYPGRPMSRNSKSSASAKIPPTGATAPAGPNVTAENASQVDQPSLSIFAADNSAIMNSLPENTAVLTIYYHRESHCIYVSFQVIILQFIKILFY